MTWPRPPSSFSSTPRQSRLLHLPCPSLLRNDIDLVRIVIWYCQAVVWACPRSVCSSGLQLCPISGELRGVQEVVPHPGSLQILQLDRQPRSFSQSLLSLPNLPHAEELCPPLGLRACKLPSGLWQHHHWESPQLNQTATRSLANVRLISILHINIKPILCDSKNFIWCQFYLLIALVLKFGNCHSFLLLYIKYKLDKDHESLLKDNV